MDASSIFTSRRVRYGLATFVAAGGVGVMMSPSADASSQSPLVAASSNAEGIALIAIGGGVLLLGVIGFVLFTWSRRKRRPSQCEAQREALALAEKAVQYWEAARAHLEAVGRGQSPGASPTDVSSHESLVANAVVGLRAAMQQRDQCQMDLIQCMASGVPAMPLAAPTPTEPRPFFIPGSNDPPSR
jgi:hypothetical protein